MSFVACVGPGEVVHHSRDLSAVYFPMVSTTFVFVISPDGISLMNGHPCLGEGIRLLITFNDLLSLCSSWAYFSVLSSSAQALSHTKLDMIFVRRELLS